MTFAILAFACAPEAPVGPSGSVPEGLAPGVGAHPDILFVVLDTVRADALGAYGNPLPISPQFDSVAAAGVLYLDATSPASWTWPAHASLFTGLYPWEHGAHFTPAGAADALHPAEEKFSASPMRTDVPTLAAQLSAAGYRTVAVATNHLLAPELGLVRGFQSATVLPEDKDTLKAALAALADPDPRPLLLFVNFMGAHSPWTLADKPWVHAHDPVLLAAPTPAWLAPFVADGFPFVHPYMQKGEGPSGGFRFMRGDLDVPEEGLDLFHDLYLGEVNLVDTALAYLLRGWNASGRGAGVVAVTSDHGDLLGERRIIGHGRVVWPEVIHVPLALVWPGHSTPGTRVTAPVQSQWVYGTILAAAGVAKGDVQLPLSDAGAPAGPIRAAEWRDDYWANDIGGPFLNSYRYYRQGTQAVIVGVDPAGLESVSLFDLDVDPGFLHDRSQEDPDSARRLAAAAREAVPLTAGGGPLSVGATTADLLHQLGYTEGPGGGPSPSGQEKPGK